jgi:N-acylneuraminate cytidylyltransferase/CMP-N,N'-diacetyllegionaminic acid synthase
VSNVCVRSVLAVILARGGSKRLPDKNVRLLNGKPLIAWSIETAKNCPTVVATLVSTDSPEIALLARQFGAETPFLRPAELADDAATSEDAVLHALDWLARQGRHFDAVVLIEPTSPLRHSQDLPKILSKLETHWHEADAVVAVGEVQLEKPQVMKHRDAQDFLTPWLLQQHAERGVAWFPYGGLYAIKTEALHVHRSFYPPRLLGHTVQPWQHFEVDSLCDFLCVEAVLTHMGGILP